MSAPDTRIIVFTCITGNYDAPILNSKVDSGIEYYCFTDDINSVHEHWQMRSLAGLDYLSKKDRNRYIKIQYSKFLPDHDFSIYIDGNIEIVGELPELIKDIENKQGDMFLYNHPFRDCIYQEAHTCIDESCDWSWRIKLHMNRYLNEGYPKENGLFENNIIIRKNNMKVHSLMDRWWQEYCNASKRDQLSLNYCSWLLGIPISTLGASDIRERGKYFYLSLEKRSRSANFLIILRKYFNKLTMVNNLIANLYKFRETF